MTLIPVAHHRPSVTFAAHIASGVVGDAVRAPTMRCMHASVPYGRPHEAAILPAVFGDGDYKCQRRRVYTTALWEGLLMSDGVFMSSILGYAIGVP